MEINEHQRSKEMRQSHDTMFVKSSIVVFGALGVKVCRVSLDSQSKHCGLVTR